MERLDKYNFSFTGFSLRVNDMLKVAEAASNGIAFERVDFGEGNSNTGKRRLNEINKRLSVLTENQIRVFLESDLTSQKQIAFLSVCKAHGFIRDFVVEVIREKLLIFDYEVSEGEYISFYRRKSDLHPEMDELTEITENKIRQVTFKILEQAGIIDNVRSKNIQQQLVSDKVASTIAAVDRQWLKIFLMSDVDIENVKI
jgi:hypothetical protein